MRVGSLVKWTETEDVVFFGVVTRIEEARTFIMWSDGVEIDYDFTTQWTENQMEIICE